MCAFIIKDSKAALLFGLFFLPLICVAKFDNNERSVICWLAEDMSDQANQPPVHSVQQQITSKIDYHSLFMNTEFNLVLKHIYVCSFDTLPLSVYTPAARISISSSKATVRLSWGKFFLARGRLITANSGWFISAVAHFKRPFTLAFPHCIKPVHSPSSHINVYFCHIEICILIYHYSTCKSDLIHTLLHRCLCLSLVHQQRYCLWLLTETVILARSPPETAISNMLWHH